MKTKEEIVIDIPKISEKHDDSFWYDGFIAEKGKFKLLACGEVRFYYNDKDGNYLGMYDGKARDDFPMPENDDDLNDMYLGENGFVCDMNNWFEILAEDDNYPDDYEILIGETFGSYDEAIEALKEIQ